MNFLPLSRPLALLGLAISLAACSTPANRRELYNTSNANGPWHDYERRLDASEETGVAPGDMGHAAGVLPPPTAAPGSNIGGTTIVRGKRPTPQPKSEPMPADQTTLPSNTAPAAVPAPASVPASPSSPTTADPSAPAAPGSQTTSPPADPGAVPPNPPTS